MPELEILRADHAAAVLAFESVNRAYFTARISDRGDAYFEHFGEQHAALLDRQESGVDAFYVLVDEDGSVLGRFNLAFVDEGVAELGYRVAEHVSGRGVATATVLDICSLAATRHGVTTLRAATSHANVASARVLLKAGFRPVGDAGPEDLGGNQGTWYERHLAPPPPTSPGEDEPRHLAQPGQNAGSTVRAPGEREWHEMTTTPQEPDSNPEVVPSGDPAPIQVDPIDPETPVEPAETENPD
jgi:ribosomal-protein-alanine N-acetyltransferase